MYNEMFIFLVYALMSFDKHIYHVTHIQAVGDLCLLRKFTSPFPSPSLLLHTWRWVTTAHLEFYSKAITSNAVPQQCSSTAMQPHGNAVTQQRSHTAMEFHRNAVTRQCSHTAHILLYRHFSVSVNFN